MISDLLAASESHTIDPALADRSNPAKRLAILTCMDVRIDPLAVFGLSLGDAHVLRNAGARVTDDVLRSLALSVHVLGVEHVIVMQHTACGVAKGTDDDLRAATGADLDFLAIADHAETIRADVARIRATPYLAPIAEVAGLLYDVATGRATRID